MEQAAQRPPPARERLIARYKSPTKAEAKTLFGNSMTNRVASFCQFNAVEIGRRIVGPFTHNSKRWPPGGFTPESNYRSILVEHYHLPIWQFFTP
jgi:hypothetical protein